MSLLKMHFNYRFARLEIASENGSIPHPFHPILSSLKAITQTRY